MHSAVEKSQGHALELIVITGPNALQPDNNRCVKCLKIKSVPLISYSPGFRLIRFFLVMTCMQAHQKKQLEAGLKI